MVRGSLLLLISSIAFVGCVPVPSHIKIATDEEITARKQWEQSLPEKDADYGEAPDSTQLKLQIEELVKSSLKDPDSAKFTNWSIVQKDFKVNSVAIRDVRYGYAICVDVNAKNSYGGYVGARTYKYIYNSKFGVPIEIYGESHYDTLRRMKIEDPSFVRRKCPPLAK